MRRGEVYLVDFGTPRGSEPTGVRPALIIQNDIGNDKSPTTIVSVITSSGVSRVFPVEVL
ncbi:MAG: type II toxin-antitoxin system PemK/MazF family toxin, partial [Armatimonadetes bacterium]|nr:type II toxin-antitoxin system PemK/MazF family toxin [Armatimonadota bacterium]